MCISKSVDIFVSGFFFIFDCPILFDFYKLFMHEKYVVKGMKILWKSIVKINKNSTIYDIIYKVRERGFMMKIQIHTDYITLGQLLKLADVIQSGGEAKIAVKTLPIQVNGEPENRRGRKLYKNDEIIINEKHITIV